MNAARPTLDQIANDSACIADLPREALASLFAKAGAVQAVLLGALLATNTEPQRAADDRLLTVEQAAERLAVTSEWLYRRHKRLGLSVKLDSGTLRFSNAAIDAYIDRNRNRPRHRAATAQAPFRESGN